MWICFKIYIPFLVWYHTCQNTAKRNLTILFSFLIYMLKSILMPSVPIFKLTSLSDFVWQYFDRYGTKPEMERSILHNANNNVSSMSKICQVCNLKKMAIVVEDSKQLLKKDVIFQTTVYTTDCSSSITPWHFLTFYFSFTFYINAHTHLIYVYNYIF